MLTVIVYANAIPINSHTAIFVKIFSQCLKVGQYSTNFPIPIIDIKHSNHRTNSSERYFVCYNFLFHPIIPQPGWKLQSLPRFIDNSSIKFDSRNLTKLISPVKAISI